MNIIDAIIDFFVRLVRGRIDSVEIRARSQAMATEARVKQAAARQFNQAIDGAVGKAKSTAASQPQGRQPHPAAAKKS